MRETRPQRWIFILSVGLLTTIGNAEQQDFRVNQPQDRPWKLNDTVCVARNGQTVCGKVVRADGYEAVVRPKMTGRGVQVILDPKPQQIAPPAPPRTQPTPTPTAPPAAAREPTTVVLPSTITMKSEPPEASPRKFSVTAGAMLGTTYFFPSVDLEFAIGEALSVGVLGVFAKGTSSGNELTAAGGMFGLSYFIAGRAPLGFFLQVGAGIYSLNGKTSTREDRATSPMGFALLGWRSSVGSGGFTLGAGLGAQYVTGATDSAIRFRGILPLCLVQIGLSL